jgi:hypothetical protein
MANIRAAMAPRPTGGATAWRRAGRPGIERRRDQRIRVRGFAALLAALAIVLASWPAAAFQNAGLRCGNRLVDVGESIDEVFERCGEPSFRDFSSEYVSFDTAPGVTITKEIPIETWTYNHGPSEFVRYLKFRSGRLVEITQGGYGY